MQKKQSDRLTVVKKRTLIVVIVADILMLAALAVQMIWLSKSLHETLQEKVDDLVGYYQFGYNERFAHLGMGVSLYGINKTGSGACQSLNGDANWQDETQKRLQHDIIGRRIEFAIVTDVNGTIWASAGPGTALGQRFNPQNVVTQFRERYPNATEQLQISLMIPSDLFQMLGSARLFVAGDDRPELRSWRNYTEVLTRTVLAPLYCGAAQLQGFQIWGDAIVPVKYDQMNRMIRSTSSAFVAIMAPNSDGNTWQTRYSYNQAGQTGWPGRFPDLVSELGSAFAERTYNGGHPLNGQFTLGPVQYMFASIPIQRTKFGSHFIDDIHSSIGLIIYAEPTYPAEEVVRTALLWHVPFGVFMAVLSVVMLFHTFRRFLDPMRALIESVKKKRLSKFNDQIRQMQQNRSALWTFLAKAVLVQGILLGLIFVNRRLIAASIHDFTSATTQGRIGKYVASSKARAMAKALNGWSGFTSIAETINSGNMTDDFRAEMQTRFHALNSDALFLLDRNANVIGATHRGAEGRAFPELGLMDYYAEALVNNTTGVRLLTALTSWPDNIVNTFTPYHYTESDPPALIRLAAASVVSPNRTLIGALVSIRLFNGFRPLWDDVVLAFGSGYYGLYEWDPFHRQFTALTTLLLTDTVRHFDVDFSNGSEEILRQGSQTAFDADGVMIRDSVLIEGASNTLSMAPYFSPIDDAVLTPLTMNAYQVTAVPQDRYDAMLAHQLEIQSSIMAFEFLTSMVALICTYWPMKRFLSNLEKAFNVPSLSQDKRQRMDETAAAMIQSGAHMEPLSVSSPRFSGVYRNVQSTVHGNRLSL